MFFPVKFCLITWLLFGFVHLSNEKKNKPPPKSKGAAPAPAPAPAPEIPTDEHQPPGQFGLNVETHPYDSSSNVNNTLLYLYPNAKPVILSVPASYLKCNFEKSCCWRNAKPPADTLEFNLAKMPKYKIKGSEVTIPPELIERYMGTREVPAFSDVSEGRFLVIGTERGNPPEEQALFISCTLECTEQPIKVTVRHWQRGCKLEVCSQDFHAKDGQNENCKELPDKDIPGPTEITLPPSPHANIVIKASHFNALSLALIDDIDVKSTPCPPPTTLPPPTTTTTTTTTTTPVPETAPNFSDAVCPAIVCNFEQGSTCNFYNSPNMGSKSKKWKVVKGSGESYLSAYLKSNDIASLESKADFPDERVVRFRIYKANDKMEMKGCCNSLETCPYDSQTTAASVWSTGSFQCPKGTQKVIFHAKNLGKKGGTIGLDNTRLLLPSGGSADNAHEIACLQK